MDYTIICTHPYHRGLGQLELEIEMLLLLHLLSLAQPPVVGEICTNTYLGDVTLSLDLVLQHVEIFGVFGATYGIGICSPSLQATIAIAVASVVFLEETLWQ